ncbi:MAG TPA: thiamine pyrophosphate-dependent enzyme [Phycisphaerae bacterium]|nr:thiamine pyrophosphate-dependent enzyme [Phycisphaerae bacterium]
MAGLHSGSGSLLTESPAPQPAPMSGQSAGQIPSTLLKKALCIRRTEERLLELYSQGKISGTVHTCIGQEWVGVAVAAHLGQGDYLFSNHRGHGHYLAFTDDVEGLLAEVMGRVTGVCGGRGGSQHLCRDGFFSNGIQGGIVPVATGLAMAQKLRGGERIAVVFVGDGTLGEGVLYESLNIAAKWELPLLIVVEDNGIAQSTERAQSLAGTIAGRAEAFDIEWCRTSTEDPADLIEQAGEAIRQVRELRRPYLLHVRTQRLKSHSKGDDTRDPGVVAAAAARDPLNRVLATDSPEVREMLAEIDRRCEAAIDTALAAEPATIVPTTPVADRASLVWKSLSFAPQRINDAIREALAEALSGDERVILLGEDVCDPYGGAFKVTARLSSRFPDRVRNTPISEAAIVGMGNGLALAGWRPVVEIMFGDFITLAFDQIVNHAAKFAWMYNDQVSVPLIVRTPMGGYRGYGPTHSQSLEKHLLGVPGTRVLALTHRYCPKLLYRRLLAENDLPTLVIENKLLYAQKSDGTPPPGCELTCTDAAFPTVRIRPAGDCQLTIVAYGGMVSLAETAAAQLAEHEDLNCELLIPTQLYPFDIRPVMQSVQHTGRLLVLEEGQGFAGFGSEIIAQVASTAGTPVHSARVYAEPWPIPAARTAEQHSLPGVNQIVTAARKLVLH